jgi:hypothetical protein
LLNYDRRGRLQDWSFNPEFAIELTRLTEITLERWEGFELFADRGFRKHHNEAGIESEWKKWLAFNASFSNGKGVNYYTASGLRPFLGNIINTESGVTLRPNSQIKIDETYIYNSLRTSSESGVPELPSGTPIFNNHIVRSKVNYQFNREMSLRVIVDYNSVLPNSALVNLEKEKHLNWDALFTYMLNPGTALYVGYTDLYDNWRLDPTLSPALRRTDFPNFNTGRQFFVKLSYLFRL